MRSPVRPVIRGGHGRKNQTKMQHHHSVDASGVFASPLGADLRALLSSSENVLAALQVDLSADLRFAEGWVVVTSERLLSCAAGSPGWASWPLGAGRTLHLQDHGGVGALSLHDASARLALWRFTLSHHAQALRLVQRFEEQSARAVGGALHGSLDADVDEPACPACHTPLPPDTDECPEIGRASCRERV